MTCILTDEELDAIELDWRRTNWPTTSILTKMVANAAARKALEMAARECDRQWATADGDTDAGHCADAIRELARGYE